MSKKGLVAMLVIPIIILLILNSAFIIATSTSSSSSSNSENQKQSLTLVKSNYEIEEDDFDDMSDKDTPITGTPLEKASAAALEYVREGRVTDTEIGDEEGYYEIEITLENGRQVDVHLDKDFKVLSTEWEDDE